MLSRRQLAADLPAGRLDVAHARPAGRDRPHQPAPEIRVGGRRVAARLRLRADRPRVTRAATGLALPLAQHEASLFQTLEVQAHTVGMQLQAPGELVGAGRASQLAEEREETRARRLRERVDRCGRHVHDGKFRTTTDLRQRTSRLRECS